jgi:lysozyme family protein
MTDARFAACLPFVLKEEGGNDDDPHDPGGRTSRGITQREYNDWCARSSEDLPTDVWKAPQEAIEAIYYQSYWLPYCPRLWPGLDLLFFDQCVNEGPVQAIKDLQRALNITADGRFGGGTLGAVWGTKKNPAALLTRYTDQRLGFYRHLRTFPYFGKGWTRRADAAQQLALSMTSSSVA